MYCTRTCVLTACTQVHAEAHKTDLHRAPPELWPRLGREEVRGGVRWHTAADFAAVSPGAAADPNQPGREELGRQLAGQAGTGIVPGQRKSRSI
jgi:hypothetical protein